ncbi:glycosyltransferase [Actinomadura verrucosospora]|uniref:Group 1 glycosyl transferase n=1 Tax=Actinomadura verrucosospora TaxID=46165 RepID=A0A7D3ZQP1_ACTVE|nr:glycosyltransferase [Actinomadura verrucosospora]QKG24202.1 group 1 glycosyl transferase [Actinomadura verrucosospora]
MTRVLHVITGLEHGGAEHQLALLLRHLPMECEVATLTHAGVLGERIRSGGVRVHELGMRGNRDLGALPRLVRLIRGGRYDVVHTHLYRACVYGRVAARLSGTPRVIATEHSLGDGHIEGRRTTRAVRALYRATERLGSMTVAVSPTVAARLRAWGVRPDRITVVPNGIDADAFAYDPGHRAVTRRRLGVPMDAHVAGCIGRLVPTKRFDLLIEAVARTPAAWLLLAGDGPERARLERLAASLGVSGRVVFTGGTDEVAPLLAAMDVYAAPSAQETFGLGVLEALAAGLPVVRTACPALDDLPPGEAPHAARLPAAAGPDAWSAAIGRRAGRVPVPPAVRRYAIEEQAAKLARLYGGHGGGEPSAARTRPVPESIPT